MQFKVPQNVQREDTIVGPLTMKQLIILAIGGGMAYLVYTTLAPEFYWQIWGPPTFLIAIVTIGFAFGKIHDLTLLQYLAYLTEYIFLPRKRIWIKGAGDLERRLFEGEEVKKTEPKKQEKNLKNIDQLVKILDSRGTIKKPE